MAIVDSEVVGMGWVSEEVTKTNAEGMWAALEYCAGNPHDFLEGIMDANATGTCDKNTGEVTFRCAEEFRVIAMKTSPLRLEFYSRSVSTPDRVHWTAPLVSVEAIIPKLVQQAGKTPVGMGTLSRGLTGVSWQSLVHNMMQSFREPEKYFKCDKVMVKDINPRQIYREITAFGQNLLENVYFNEDIGEAVCRAVKDGKEVDVERVCVLRTDPMSFEFFQRNVTSGDRVFWKMGQAIVLGDVEIWLKQASQPPSTPPAPPTTKT